MRERAFGMVLGPLFATFVVLLTWRPSAGQQQDTAPPAEVKRSDAAADDLDEMLEWLPEDSETLIVARGPFQLEALSDDNDPEERIDRIWPRMASALLASIRKGKLVEPLKSHPVSLAIEGSRRFRAPTGLGMMRFEGCQIIRFESDLKVDGQKLMDGALQAADKRHKIGEYDVAEFTEPFEQDVWQIFVARPKPDLLLVASDEKYLREVLDRMGHDKQESRAFPPEIPEWKHVEKQEKVWAIRHFDRHDPEAFLNPLDEIGSEFADDPMATGLVFRLSNDSRVAAISYLGGAAVVRGLKQEGLSLPSPSDKPFDVKIVQPGAVEFSLRLEDAETDGYFLFVLLALLGHGVYV
jgi:hypothetical protein